MQPIRVMGMPQAKHIHLTPLAERERKAVTPMSWEDLMAWIDTLPGYETTWGNVKLPNGEMSPMTYEVGFAVHVEDTPEAIALGKDALFSHFKAYLSGFHAATDGATIFWRDKPEVDTWRDPEDATRMFVKLYTRFTADTFPAGTESFIWLDREPPPGWLVVEHIVRDQAKRIIKQPQHARAA